MASYKRYGLSVSLGVLTILCRFDFPFLQLFIQFGVCLCYRLLSCSFLFSIFRGSRCHHNPRSRSSFRPDLMWASRLWFWASVGELKSSPHMSQLNAGSTSIESNMQYYIHHRIYTLLSEWQLHYTKLFSLRHKPRWKADMKWSFGPSQLYYWFF